MLPVALSIFHHNINSINFNEFLWQMMFIHSHLHWMEYVYRRLNKLRTKTTTTAYEANRPRKELKRAISKQRRFEVVKRGNTVSVGGTSELIDFYVFFDIGWFKPLQCGKRLSIQMDFWFYVETRSMTTTNVTILLTLCTLSYSQQPVDFCWHENFLGSIQRLDKIKKNFYIFQFNNFQCLMIRNGFSLNHCSQSLICEYFQKM